MSVSVSDDPKHPLDSMDFLDGYLSFVYEQDDLPDGAWFCALQDTIAEKWPKCDAHECLMRYLEWKSEPRTKT